MGNPRPPGGYFRSGPEGIDFDCSGCLPYIVILALAVVGAFALIGDILG